MKRLDIHIRDGDCAEMILRVIKASEAIDYFVTPQRQKDRIVVTVFARDGDGQALQDALRETLDNEAHWRMSVSTIDATSPALPERSKTSLAQHNKLMREELYANAENDGDPDLDFFLLTFLSTVVAAIGLNSDSAAAVIGSMVIAPLLGPIVAVSLGIALGDLWLIRRSGAAIAAGLGLVWVGAFGIGQLVPIDLQSDELIQRAEVGLEGLALAIAAGAAGAISRLKGVGASLVGVMVAAALLPSGAASGVFAAADRWDLASRAMLLTLLNVASLIVSAVLVFRIRRITPRRDNEKAGAQHAVIVSLMGLTAMLGLAVLLIIVLDLGAAVEITTGDGNQ